LLAGVSILGDNGYYKAKLKQGQSVPYINHHVVSWAAISTRPDLLLKLVEGEALQGFKLDPGILNSGSKNVNVGSSDG
jgi:hypothetical protein